MNNPNEMPQMALIETAVKRWLGMHEIAAGLNPNLSPDRNSTQLAQIHTSGGNVEFNSPIAFVTQEPVLGYPPESIGQVYVSTGSVAALRALNYPGREQDVEAQLLRDGSAVLYSEFGTHKQQLYLVQRKLGRASLKPIWSDMTLQNQIPIEKVEPGELYPALVRINDRTKLDQVPGSSLVHDIVTRMTMNALQMAESNESLFLVKIEESVLNQQRARKIVKAGAKV